MIIWGPLFTLEKCGIYTAHNSTWGYTTVPSNVWYKTLKNTLFFNKHFPNSTNLRSDADITPLRVIARRREKYYTKQFSKVGRSGSGIIMLVLLNIVAESILFEDFLRLSVPLAGYHRCCDSSSCVLCGTDSRFVPCQWETALLCNNVSHWLGTNLESALPWCCVMSYTVSSRCHVG